jgi:hypothetical protein
MDPKICDEALRTKILKTFSQAEAKIEWQKVIEMPTGLYTS